MAEKTIKGIVIIVATLLISQSALAADRITVFVSINPHQYFVQQIGKDLVDVRVMVPPGASPATYEPRPKQMADLSAARVYFAIGVAFENAWLEKISAVNPGMKVVHTDDGIKKIPLAAHFHPAWGYFGRAYGHQQVPIEIEGKSPKPARLKALIEHAGAKGIKVIFVQPQFSSKSAELVAREIGGRVVFADPLAEDWLANLTAVADRFKAALK
jgi:ABC-type Zn uptake system ZnuABC Zn-binding protein ZnuA